MLVSKYRRLKSYPTEAESEAAAPATPPAQCPGCKGNVEKHHPMHNSVPGACEVSHVETIQYD
eukprot:6581261-Karenia_brevis.AAC.1